MKNNNYFNINSEEGLRRFIEFDNDLYYKDKLILDIYPSLVRNPIIYKTLTNKLQVKGYNILYKGNINNTFFGLPTSNIRLLIACSKEKSSIFFSELDLFTIPSCHISPLALLYGKNMKHLKKEYDSIINKLGSAPIDKDFDFDYYKERYNILIKNNAFKKLGIKGNVNAKNKFSLDSSNKKPSNSKKMRDKIDNNDRIPLLASIYNAKENYYHFNPSRTGCSVREIARLNGYADSFSLAGFDRDSFINLVNNTLSPFGIEKVFELL